MEKKYILEKIEKIFFEKNFKEVSLKDIADELSIRKASLYYYFPSKKDIFLEVLEFSFENYKNIIEKILKLPINEFIEAFISLPHKEKNLFAILGQSSYCELKDIKKIIQKKQKVIYSLIKENLGEKYDFSKEKTFIFMSIIEELGRKKCINGGCDIELHKLSEEIKKLFF